MDKSPNFIDERGLRVQNYKNEKKHQKERTSGVIDFIEKKPQQFQEPVYIILSLEKTKKQHQCTLKVKD